MLKKEMVLPAPKKAVPELGYKQALKKALHVIGYHFTKTWVANQTNRKLDGFTTDAQWCFEKVRDYRQRVFTFLLWFLGIFVGVNATYLAIGQDRSIFSGIAGGLTILCALMTILHGMYSLTYNVPTKTERMVAKAWKQWLNTINEVAEKLEGQIRYDAESTRLVKSYQYGHKELEQSLGFVLEESLRKSARQVCRAERDQNEARRKKFRKQFGRIDKFGQALGFEKANWEKIFSQVTIY